MFKLFPALRFLILLFFLLVILFIFMNTFENPVYEHPVGVENSKSIKGLIHHGLQTETTITAIDLSLILSGGVGKDGIPAIHEPKFTSISDSSIHDDTRGILITTADKMKSRFYPYSIIVWHEIVNDTFDGIPIAVTFCPLCETGIVFNRRIGESVVTFGVSGLLYESNLLMYDIETESLWSQTLGKAVVGTYTNTQLVRLPIQVITFKEVKEKYPTAHVLSTDTSFNRDYTRNPYSGYAETERVEFEVTNSDSRYHAKEPFYVIPYSNKSFALPFRQFKEGTQTFSIPNDTLTITRDGDEITAVTNTGALLPGYFEYWFSWITHHHSDGTVLTPTL